MTPMFYHVVHVFALVALVGYSFYAFAAPVPETKRRIMTVTGIASLLQLVAGFGLIHTMGYSMSQGWIWVKIVCWLGLGCLPALAYRKREKAGTFIVIGLILVLIALVMVYYKPF
ncbi:MAG TPA: hypothetical protein VFT72_14610 [Opitutaceae bacterium]|nr:hypothetical protein [Opitutaceae bacterium]